MKLKGELISVDETFMFRVYTKDGNFIDYKLLAADISITINDPFITAKVIDNEDVLDYTDAVLGVE